MSMLASLKTGYLMPHTGTILVYIEAFIFSAFRPKDFDRLAGLGAEI